MKCMSSGSPLMMVKNGNGNMMTRWLHLFSTSTPVVSITYRRQITTMTSKGMTAPPIMAVQYVAGRDGTRPATGYTFSSRLSHVPNNMNHNNDGFSGDGRHFNLMSRGGW
ncbi:hypothetical protein YC2023_117148 [Brassica napus]